jgi:hypothetical protein
MGKNFPAIRTSQNINEDASYGANKQMALGRQPRVQSNAQPNGNIRNLSQNS